MKKRIEFEKIGRKMGAIEKRKTPDCNSVGKRHVPKEGRVGNGRKFGMTVKVRDKLDLFNIDIANANISDSELKILQKAVVIIARERNREKVKL